LPLAAGKLRWIVKAPAAELRELEQFVHSASYLGFRWAQLAGADAQTEGDVLEHCHVAEQRIVLEHETDAPFAWLSVEDILAVDDHSGVGIRIRPVEARDDTQ
jgi:hypothetical protein